MTTLRITLFNGRNLLAADVNGKSDPYATFTLGQNTVKSKVKSNTLNPNWNEELELPVTLAQDHILEVHVFDKDVIGKSDSLGVAKIDLAGLQLGVQSVVLVRLLGGDDGENIIKIIEQKLDSGLEQQSSIGGKLAGSLIDSTSSNIGVLTLGLTLLNQSSDPIPSGAKSVAGNVVIRVFGCAHLRGTDVNGKADPYVELQIGETKVKSKTKKENLNPNWEGQQLQLPFQSEGDNLIVNVKDHDLVGHSDLIGSVVIPLSSLIRGQEVISTYSLTGGEFGENLSHHADELKANIAGEVMSQVAGNKVGGLISKVGGKNNKNPGLISLGLTL